jgi:hypothetical protein
MKKKILSFIKGCIAIVLLLVVAAVLFSVVSFMGVFIGVLVLFFLILTLPVLIYKAVVK